MADILSDANTRVSWVTTISNPAAPTVAELNAGVALESFITPDGFSVSTSTAAVDTSALNSSDNTSAAGRRSDDISITMTDQGQAAAPWTTFSGKPSGYVVRRSGIAASTAWTASQKVQVFPSQAGDRQMSSPAPNELQKFTVPFFKTAAVQDAATVA